MDNYQTQAQYFKVLMHPTRLAILDLLRDEEQCVCHIEAILGLRQAHISQHLMVLREAGLVADRRVGWNIFYRVTQPKIYMVIDAMQYFSGVESGVAPKPSLTMKTPCLCPKCTGESNPPQAGEADVMLNLEASFG